jgi:hypothetical protein
MRQCYIWPQVESLYTGMTIFIAGKFYKTFTMHCTYYKTSLKHGMPPPPHTSLSLIYTKVTFAEAPTLDEVDLDKSKTKILVCIN